MVQPRIVESLSDVLAGRKDGSCLVPRDSCQSVSDGLPLLLAHPRSQYDEVTNTRDEPILESIEVIVSLGEDQR